MATTITAITASLADPGTQRRAQFQSLFSVIPFRVAILDATLPAQTSSQVTTTVTGAELGDIVLLAVAHDQTGLILTGAVSAANTVKITAFNTEGTDANTVLSTARVVRGIVLKPSANIWDAPE